MLRGNTIVVNEMVFSLQYYLISYWKFQSEMLNVCLLMSYCGQKSLWTSHKQTLWFYIENLSGSFSYTNYSNQVRPIGSKLIMFVYPISSQPMSMPWDSEAWCFMEFLECYRMKMLIGYGVKRPILCKNLLCWWGWLFV